MKAANAQDHRPVAHYQGLERPFRPSRIRAFANDGAIEQFSIR
jgi:hypothetical protein